MVNFGTFWYIFGIFCHNFWRPHTYIHTYLHTYIHTYILVRSIFSLCVHGINHNLAKLGQVPIVVGCELAQLPIQLPGAVIKCQQVILPWMLVLVSNWQSDKIMTAVSWYQSLFCHAAIFCLTGLSSSWVATGTALAGLNSQTLSDYEYDQNNIIF